ncbi:hypothetical protein NKG05_11920 [Oerskovia sp. M15]
MLLEDARTGEVRWTRTVPAEQVEGGGFGCEIQTAENTVIEDRASDSVHDVGGAVVVADGCGGQATLSLRGKVLSSDHMRYIQPTRDGRLLRAGGDMVTTDVLDASGRVLWTVEGHVSESLVTDGTAPGLLFSQLGSGVVALDESGQKIWAFRATRPRCSS